MPPWQDDFEPSLQYIMLCLLLLHLGKGLIQDDQMDQLVDDYLNQIGDSYMPSEDNGDNLHNGNYSIFHSSRNRSALTHQPC